MNELDKHGIAHPFSTVGAGHPDQKTAAQSADRTAEEAPDERSVGDEEMTDTQWAYLKALCEAAGEPFDGDLTTAEACKRITWLQQKTGRRPKHIVTDEQTDG